MRHGKLDVEGGRWGLLQECLLGVVWLQQGRQNLTHEMFAIISDSFPLRLEPLQPNICVLKISQFPTVLKIILVCLEYNIKTIRIQNDSRYVLCQEVDGKSMRSEVEL